MRNNEAPITGVSEDGVPPSFTQTHITVSAWSLPTMWGARNRVATAQFTNSRFDIYKIMALSYPRHVCSLSTLLHSYKYGSKKETVFLSLWI
jgi:hypothetical protein